MKKTVAPGAKTPLFDRVFKPEIITLENGHTVTRPRSRTPLIALLVFAALAISVHVMASTSPSSPSAPTSSRKSSLRSSSRIRPS